jgi:hypothetical protein
MTKKLLPKPHIAPERALRVKIRVLYVSIWVVGLLWMGSVLVLGHYCNHFYKQALDWEYKALSYGGKGDGL